MIDEYDYKMPHTPRRHPLDPEEVADRCDREEAEARGHVARDLAVVTLHPDELDRRA